MNRERSPVIGIDLGTTYSLCSVIQAGRPVMLTNAVGETLTASAVSVDDSGHMLVGGAARARASTHPQATALAFKRDMGTDRTYELGGKHWRAEQLSALVLGELKRDAEHTLGCEVREAVITVPAYFGEAQRRATRFAGELAGLEVERIINEPTAAAMAYGLHARSRDLRGIVLDLGGGTFDVTVLEICEGVIEVQSSAGDSRLGGEDWSDVLAADIHRRLREQLRAEFEHDPLSVARIREAAESAKRRLTHALEARIALPGLTSQGRAYDAELTITRDRAHALWQPLLARIAQPIARALRDAQLDAAAFDEVLVVGGASRMACFTALVAQTFGRMPSRELPPDEAVAMGAAVQAALREQSGEVEDLVVTDVAPFTLGIASATHFGSSLVTGMFAPIIDRGTVIPVSRSKAFRTISDDQPTIEIEVFQGEHSMCKDNTPIGRYTVIDLPKRSAGEVAIDVRFTYDLNGILEVETTVQETGDVQAFTIENQPGKLTPEQVQLAREAMKSLKFHPREALPNRTALARAEALFVELRGDDREGLAHAIAQFQGALQSQRPELIVPAREHLIALTSTLARASR